MVELFRPWVRNICCSIRIQFGFGIGILERPNKAGLFLGERAPLRMVDLLVFFFCFVQCNAQIFTISFGVPNCFVYLYSLFEES